MRLPAPRCAALWTWIRVSACSHAPVAHSFALRRLHGARVLPISIADRIKQFLPAEAIESEDDRAAMIQETEVPTTFKGTSISAFSPEIREVEKLVTRDELSLACEQLLLTVPLPVAFSALVERIVPMVAQGPLAALGVHELAFHLHAAGQAALASQLMQSADPRYSDQALQMREFELVQDLNAGDISARDVDQAILLNLGSSLSHILDHSGSPWLRARILAALNYDDFASLLQKKRYSTLLPGLGPAGIALLVMANRSSRVYTLVSRKIFEEWLPDDVNALVSAVRSDEGFSRAWRQLKRRLKDSKHPINDPVLVLAVPAVLKVALRLRKTYDIASICRYGAPYLTRHPKLIAKALLAAAFAQKRSGDVLKLVAEPKSDLSNFLVRRVLTPVLDQPQDYDYVVSLAVARLQEVGGSSRVLWQLMMSLPPDITLGGRSTRQLAPLVSSRPYVEQLRYMALQNVSVRGVGDVLRLHVYQLMEHRRVNRVPDSAKQANDDVHLLMSGMLIASEKVGRLGVDTEAQTRELATIVSEVFENWAPERSQDLLSTTAHFKTQVAPIIVQQVVRSLVEQKAYALVQQIMQWVTGPFRPATVEVLLLGVAKDVPAQTYSTISELLRAGTTTIQPHVLSNVLMTLCKTPLLTEAQLSNQFQNIRRIMHTRLNVRVQPGPAAALVDALLASALASRGGSCARLRWALEVAKISNVATSEFSRWADEIMRMQQEKQGYWAV